MKFSRKRAEENVDQRLEGKPLEIKEGTYARVTLPTISIQNHVWTKDGDFWQYADMNILNESRGIDVLLDAVYENRHRFESE